MEFCDTSVRVLFDFEYTTKYGRHIKILPGERLLLIKKTNDDWWQVIRSSEQRPFFVPASYVEEIEPRQRAASRDQRKSRSSSEKIPSEKGAVTSTERPEDDQHYSIEPQGVLEDSSTARLASSSEKHSIVSNLNNEHSFRTKPKLTSSTLSSSGYNSLCEEIPVFGEDEVSSGQVDTISQYKNNISLENNSRTYSDSKSNCDNTRYDVIDDPPTSDNELSVNRDSSLHSAASGDTESKLYMCKDITGKYCSVVNTTAGKPEVSSRSIHSTLPASDSIENLTLQIELKTNSLRNSNDKLIKNGSISMSKNNLNSSSVEAVSQVKNVSSQNCSVSPNKESKGKSFANLLQNKACKESRSSESVCPDSQIPVYSNNLHYQGSFKTDIERQRLLKKSSSEKRLRNIFSCSEESNLGLPTSHQDQTVSTSSKNIVGVNNEESCTISYSQNIKIPSKTDEVLQRSDYKNKGLHNRQLHFGSDGQLAHILTARERTTSRHSLDSVIEGELKETSSEGKEHNIYGSNEFSKTALTIQHTNSEISSNDSLLDIDRDYRKISGGTTSDSLVPTDGEDLATTDSEAGSVKQTSVKQDDLKYSANGARKKPLIRRRRVLSSKTRIDSSQEPPSPTPNQSPSRALGEDWNEYDTEDGRKYFYNLQTKDKRWKPPRRTYHTSLEGQDEQDSTEAAEEDGMFVVSLPIPSGWRSEIDLVSGQTCYINIGSGSKWFSSTDSEGRVYFFEENSNKSSWALPEIELLDKNEDKETQSVHINTSTSSLEFDKGFNRNVKSKSMVLAPRNEEASPVLMPASHWPQLSEGTMCVLKEGPLNKTKITENGKRLRKNWTSTHAVLTELLLLFFKDNKGFPSMMSGNGRPELSVDLNGAVIDSGDKVSSRKHVYLLSTMLGLQVLIQCDCATSANQWLQAIQSAIHQLPLSVDAVCPRIKPSSPPGKPVKLQSLTEEKSSRISRSKSMKLKNKSASIEDLSGNPAERQIKIRERLKKFFNRRPAVELLVKKGIWKDEPVFGCLLEQICPAEPPRVPLFVQHCIRCIERSEDNMRTDGLYRASGNLSQVQKIRLQVDQNIYNLLDEEEDVHVLAGTLKLFFRELKQPLIPFKFFTKALSASTNYNRNEKTRDFREIVKALPPCNHDTLKVLLQHLLKVTRYQEHNRMHIPNIAIVFGPTLMWPEQESTNMAFDLMQQNLVIESFLLEFDNIFHRQHS